MARNGFMALPSTYPVGSPSSFRSNRPPSGSGVALVIPASLSAAEFTNAETPSARGMKSGFVMVKASTSCLVRNRCSSVHSRSIQPRPKIHSSSGVAFAHCSIARTVPERVSIPKRLKVLVRRPTPSKCWCASVKPGNMMLCPKSIVGTDAHKACLLCDSVPTKVIRSPNIATVSAVGAFGLAV